MDLQYKWDVFLLTNFFMHPFFSIRSICGKFVKKNNISFEEFNSLKRTPQSSRYNYKASVSSFCSNNLGRNFGNMLYEKAIDDVFDIAETLKNSTVCFVTNESSASYRKVIKSVAKNDGIGLAHYESAKRRNDLCSKRAWHVCK